MNPESSPPDSPNSETLDPRFSYNHPLEVVAYFRRWPRSFARDILYTVIFNTAIGLMFQVISMMSNEYTSVGQFFRNLGVNWLVSNVIGFTFHFCYSLLGPLLRRVNRLPFWAIVLDYTLMGAVIYSAGALLTSLIPGYGHIREWIGTLQWLVSSLAISFFISLAMALAWRSNIRTLMRESELALERERLAAAERAAVEANLRALQAQIEPHFLFNTLANVVSLIEPSPQKARLMLQDFIDYLRASLASTRAQTSSLGREADLMRAFLRLIQIRMGDRLSFRVDVPDALRSVEFPPMLLQPLIENAVKHGLEPTITGGEIIVRAQAAGGFLEILIEDNGQGFQGDAQSGLGLANVRERITGIYGAAASFAIEGRAPAGTRIVIRVPLPQTAQVENVVERAAA
jgi:sensor histidine kinase YesM